MENRKYVVCRDDIYVGEVVQADCIYRYEGEHNFFNNTKPGQLTTNLGGEYRSILFVPNEDKLANDLLYRTPSYPILNVTDDETCLNLEEDSIVIRGAYNLAVLLEYFGYQKDLTYEDIIRIRKTFFTGRFAKDHCELFGWKESKPEDMTYYKNGVEITELKELRRCIAQERRSQKSGHRSFGTISESVLPREYWNILDDRGDHTLRDVIEGWSERMNAFTPPKEEGPIKKLTRF